MSRLLKIDRWLLDPMCVIITLFGMQALVWWLWMPDIPVVKGAAPRVESPLGLQRFFLLFLPLLVGLFLGKVVAATFIPIPRPRQVPSSAEVRTFLRVAYWALLLTVIGEVVYTRSLFTNLSLFSKALYDGSFANIGEFVRSQRVQGLSSLNNLFIIPAAIYGLVAFHPSLEPTLRKKIRRRLLWLAIAVLVHALVLAARLLFILFLVIVMATYLLLQAKSNPRLARAIWASLIGGIAVIWVGETMRSGLRYANQHETSCLSAEAQQHVRDVLVEGYIGADFNNAMVLLSSEPSMQLVSTTPVFAAIAKALNEGELRKYSMLPAWLSAFGTVNVLGLWWYDFGWLTVPVALASGAWLGACYVMARRTADSLRLACVFFLISFPASFCFIRLNYFGLTVFVAPFVFLTCVVTIRMICVLRACPATRATLLQDS